jgi:hypothetical protein
MRPPRFTLRMSMIAVAIAALAPGGWVLVHRSREFDEMASGHECLFATCVNRIETMCYFDFEWPDRTLSDSRQSWRDLIDRRLQYEERVYQRERESNEPPHRFTTSQELLITKLERRALYEEGLYHKSRRAALFPWLAISPDSAPPELPDFPADFFYQRRGVKSH